jgi:hypothetical protein
MSSYQLPPQKGLKSKGELVTVCLISRGFTKQDPILWGKPWKVGVSTLNNRIDLCKINDVC